MNVLPSDFKIKLFEIISDEEIYLHFLNKNLYWMPGSTIFRFCTEKIRKNKSLSLAAIKKGAYAFKYIDESLKNDIKFIKKCIKSNSLCMLYIDKNRTDYRELVKISVKTDPRITYFISPELHSTIEVNKTILGIDPSDTFYINKKFLDDIPFWEKAFALYENRIPKKMYNLIKPTANFSGHYSDTSFLRLRNRNRFSNYSAEDTNTDNSIFFDEYELISKLLNPNGNDFTNETYSLTRDETETYRIRYLLEMGFNDDAKFMDKNYYTENDRSKLNIYSLIKNPSKTTSRHFIEKLKSNYLDKDKLYLFLGFNINLNSTEFLELIKMCITPFYNIELWFALIPKVNRNLYANKNVINYLLSNEVDKFKSFVSSYPSWDLLNKEDFILLYNKFYEIEYSTSIVIPEELLNDKVFALEILKKNAKLIKYFSNEIKDDEEVAIAALNGNWDFEEGYGSPISPYQYLSSRLKRKKERNCLFTF